MMNTLPKTQQGFTLIELMIVVAIIGILAAIAVPAYQDYMARSKISEAMGLLDAAKTSVAEWCATNNCSTAWPADSATAGITTNPSANYVSSMAWNNTNHRVEATLNNNINSALDGKKIWLTATAGTDNALTWSCGTDAGSSNYKYLPSNCRSAS